MSQEVLKTVTHKDIKIDVVYDDRGRISFRPATERGAYGYTPSYGSLQDAKDATTQATSTRFHRECHKRRRSDPG